MALSEWGENDLEPVDKLNLLHAYIRRQQFLARLQALEMGRMLFGDKEPKEISTAEMMALIGAE